MRAAALRRLAEVDAAIARVGTPQYGVCAVCGTPIPPARLAARPCTTRCILHA